MKCPHCTVTVHTQTKTAAVTEAADKDGQPIAWQALHEICPHCKEAIIWLAAFSVNVYSHGARQTGPIKLKIMCWPQSSERPVPAEVPADIQQDFAEAVRVLPLSPQSSAALTRRALQQILRDYAKTTKRDLFDQIQEVLDAGHLPSSLAQQLHAVRAIGNFAAHPLKSQSTGLILPVEPNEAEWNLDVLEDMFDHYFVKPSQTQKRLDSLNKKLTDAGKPTI